MKKTLLVIFTFGFFILPISSFAQTPNDYEIIPKATNNVSTAVEEVGKSGGNVRENYNEQAANMSGNV